MSQSKPSELNTDSFGLESFVGNESGVIPYFNQPYARIPSEYLSRFFYRAQHFYRNWSGNVDQTTLEPVLKEMGCYCGYVIVCDILEKEFKCLPVGVDLENCIKRTQILLSIINRLGWGKWTLLEPFRMEQIRFRIQNPLEYRAHMPRIEEDDSVRFYFSGGLSWAIMLTQRMKDVPGRDGKSFRAIFYDKQFSILYQVPKDVAVQSNEIIIESFYGSTTEE